MNSQCDHIHTENVQAGTNNSYDDVQPTFLCTYHVSVESIEHNYFLYFYVYHILEKEEKIALVFSQISARFHAQNFIFTTYDHFIFLSYMCMTYRLVCDLSVFKCKINVTYRFPLKIVNFPYKLREYYCYFTEIK